ncbi:MAG: pentapeptide repeat-containing protein [Patescibacteria group bacterium]
MANQNIYEGENFSKVTFTNDQLNDKTFIKCHFYHCFFNEQNLRECIFEDCNFEGCDLSLSKLNNCRFTDVEFKSSKLIGIDWTKSSKTFLEVGFENCNISHSIFMGLNLKKTKIQACEAKDCDFTDTNLTESSCNDTDFTESIFSNTNLTSADLSHAKNYLIDPNFNIVKKAKFTFPEVMGLLSNLDIIVE